MSSATVWTPRPARPSTGWVGAKWLVLLGYLAFVVSSFAWPESTARAFWFVVVPLLPVTFLLNAKLWRNVCPLATLNTLATGGDGGRPLDRRSARIATVLGIGLLLVAIPSRHVLFNESGVATGVLLGAAGLVALVSGIPFRRKAGFCNSLCPILPVERLYGQLPLVVTENARCTPCHVCTRAACFDLNPGRSALQTLGAGVAGRPWMILPFGAFALALPGVILGYYLTPSIMGGSGNPYAIVGVGAGVSWAILGTVASVLRVRPAEGLRGLALLSVGLYYGFTPGVFVDAYGLSEGVATTLRVTLLAFVAYWAWRGARGRPGPGGRASRALPIAPSRGTSPTR